MSEEAARNPFFKSLRDVKKTVCLKCNKVLSGCQVSNIRRHYKLIHNRSLRRGPDNKFFDIDLGLNRDAADSDSNTSAIEVLKNDLSERQSVSSIEAEPSKAKQNSTIQYQSAEVSQHPPMKRMKDSSNFGKLPKKAAFNRSMKMMSPNKPNDEFSEFGDYVGNELRLLSAVPDIQSKLRCQVQQLIACANMKKHSRIFENQATVTIDSITPDFMSMSSTNTTSHAQMEVKDEFVTEII